MRKLCAVLGIALAISVLAGSGYALTGPANGGYLWMVDIQYLGAQENVDLELSVIKVNPNYRGDGASFTTFSPMVPDNYTDPTAWRYGPGERSGLPTIYEPSTTDGYGKLLTGTYCGDNDPAASNPARQTMDIYRLEPQADTSLTMVNVHTGKAYASSEFNTEDASNVIYDKDGEFTGTANSVVVWGGIGGMTSRSRGYATDVDADGVFDGAGDNDTYQNWSNMPGKKVQYKNTVYGDSGWLGTQGGINYGGSDGVITTTRADNGAYVNKLYYADNATGIGGSVDFSGSGDTSGPGIAIGDPNGNGVPDVYSGVYRVYVDHDDNVETPDQALQGLGHYEDKNADGDAMDAGEHEVFLVLGRQNYGNAPWDPDNTVWTSNGGASPIAVVTTDNGSALICTMPGYWRYGRTLFALGIADNGEFSGEAEIIATNAGGSSDPWPHIPGLDPMNYYLFEVIQDAAGAIPGDSNGDGKVDGGDLAIWQQNYDPLGGGNNTFALGDWNNDGKIDGGDLALWQQNYDPIGPTGADGMGANVPEPATLLLLGTGLAGACGIFRRRRMK